MIQSKQINRSEYSLDERERLSSEVRIDDAVPHVLLATCNRTELYWGEGEIPEELAYHLFRVAAGLESSLIGERAIQGQIKQAYTLALERYKLPSTLNRLFQCAMHVGKRVRTETQIAAGAVSHSQVTADMLRKHGIDLKNKIVGIIGVNKLTEDILKYLTARGAVNIYLSNRNIDKARELAVRYGGTAMGLDKKHDLLRFSDVLICATSAPHTIVHIDDFAEDRSEQMILFDLAFPRDIDPAVGNMPGMTLYNLEDIESFARRNLSLRRGEIAKAEAIIEEEMEKLMKWQEVKTQKLRNLQTQKLK
ncbi:MAG: glutamyl-tRNA reductase [Bacteroides sp.]|nr:glutamyl-tRNA reductase [Bacteroides sp.]